MNNELKTYDAHILHESFDVLQKIKGIDLTLFTPKKDFVVFRGNVDQIRRILHLVDDAFCNEGFEENEISSLYLAIDTALQQYYFENDIED